MKKYFRKEKPSNNQIIGFKATKAHYPEIGVFQSFDNGIEEVYIPANDDVEQLINIDYNGLQLYAVVCRLCAVGKLRIGAVRCLVLFKI
jgi:hypothetical protein